MSKPDGGPAFPRPGQCIPAGRGRQLTGQLPRLAEQPACACGTGSQGWAKMAVIIGRRSALSNLHELRG